MSTLRRIAHTAHPLAAATVVLLVFVQVYLIAAYIFGEPGALDTHMTVGRIAVFFELIVLLTALIGWRSDRSEIWMSVALFLVGALQASLAKDIGKLAVGARAARDVRPSRARARVAHRSPELAGGIPASGAGLKPSRR